MAEAINDESLKLFPKLPSTSEPQDS